MQALALHCLVACACWYGAAPQNPRSAEEPGMGRLVGVGNVGITYTRIDNNAGAELTFFGWGLRLGAGYRYGFGIHTDIVTQLTLGFQIASQGISLRSSNPDGVPSDTPTVRGVDVGIGATVRWLPSAGTTRWYLGLGPGATVGMLSFSGDKRGDGSYAPFTVEGILESGVVLGDRDDWDVGVRFLPRFNSDGWLSFHSYVAVGRAF